MKAMIKLSQTAPWNPKLTNPYRTRYATAAGRYFEVKADYLGAPWFIHEIDADGEWMGEDAFNALAFRLSDARDMIAEATR